ncbi:MAG: hypothetical protein HGB36_10275 [Chlorobiaceae bacterium]|nr:hypothetical protein [Chlorobiaceae bacterium]
MPLVCDKCGLADIAEVAKYCPRCSTALKKDALSSLSSKGDRKSGSVMKTVLLFLVIPSFILAVGLLRPPGLVRVAVKKVVLDNVTTSAVPGNGIIRTKWNYDSYPDQKGRGQILTATLVSRNTVEFNFPYDGAQHATLTLYKHPKYGKEVLLSIEKGRFLTGVPGAYGNVCFDNKPVIEFPIEAPADHRPTHVVLKGYDEFVNEMKKSSKIRIEVPFKDEGTHVFEFSVAGLKSFD